MINWENYSEADECVHNDPTNEQLTELEKMALLAGENKYGLNGDL